MWPFEKSGATVGMSFSVYGRQKKPVFMLRAEVARVDMGETHGNLEKRSWQALRF